MNAAQRGMYHGEKTKWQKACHDLGRPCDDAALRALHAKVGAPYSSTAFSQDDLTRVIGEFKAISAMGDFGAQMKAQGTLKERHLADIDRLANQIGINGGRKGVSNYYRKWLGGIPVDRLPDEMLGKLVGMMTSRAKQLAPKPAPALMPDVEVNDDPGFDPEQPFG